MAETHVRNACLICVLSANEIDSTTWNLNGCQRYEHGSPREAAAQVTNHLPHSTNHLRLPVSRGVLRLLVFRGTPFLRSLMYAEVLR